MEVKKMPPQMMNCISDPADLGIRRDAHVPTAAARVVLLLGGGMTCVYDRLDLSVVERCSNSWHRRSRPQWWGRPREFEWAGSRLDGCVDRVRLRSGSTAPAVAKVQPVVPMRYLPVPHTEHTARRAGSPFVIVTCSTFFGPVLALHFKWTSQAPRTPATTWLTPMKARPLRSACRSPRMRAMRRPSPARLPPP